MKECTNQLIKHLGTCVAYDMLSPLSCIQVLVLLTPPPLLTLFRH